MGSRPTIFCVTAESLRIYDLFRPARPRLVTHAVGLELEGVLPQLGLAWGQSGLARFDLRPTGLELRPVADQASPTHSVVRRRNVIFCMRRGALDVLDVELRRVGSIELEGSGQLLVVGDTLFATGRDGVMTFDVSKPREPRETGSYELRDVVHLEQAGFGFARASERALPVHPTGDWKETCRLSRRPGANGRPRRLRRGTVVRRSAACRTLDHAAERGQAERNHLRDRELDAA